MYLDNQPRCKGTGLRRLGRGSLGKEGVPHSTAINLVQTAPNLSPREGQGELLAGPSLAYGGEGPMGMHRVCRTMPQGVGY